MTSVTEPRLSSEIPNPIPEAPKLPVCPHCGQDPAHIAATVTRLGGIVCAVVFCENRECRKVHSVFPIAVPDATQPPKGGLWVP